MNGNLVNFIIIAATVGPVGAIPYGLKTMSELEIFLFLSIIYILPLPILFKLFEFGGTHRRVYRMRIFKKVSVMANKRIMDIARTGDRVTDMFKERWGHLGFYFSISILTFLFGVFWAAVISYILMVKRKRAIASIAIGVVIGNIFWLIIITHFKSMITPIEVIALVLLFPVMIYAIKREIKVIKEVAIRLHLRH